MTETFFITGAQGCIGSWIVKALVERGDEVVVFDRDNDPRRLTAIMNLEDVQRVRFMRGDITDTNVLTGALESSGARRVIHLAGLQVPTCKADPITGALVNVVGTINVFEAARQQNVNGVVYASSAAVYGLSDGDGPLDETADCTPSTHYGVFKRTNEGNAHVYFIDHGLSSVGLRPLTVYGVNRDSGLTSDPTKAMKSAVLGRPFHIRFGGTTDFQFVADTAAAFIACSDSMPEGAHVFNLHGDAVGVDAITAEINKQTPNGSDHLITFGGPPIPVAPNMNDAAIRKVINDLPATPLSVGVQKTMDQFARLRDEGRLDTSDIDV